MCTQNRVRKIRSPVRIPRSPTHFLSLLACEGRDGVSPLTHARMHASTHTHAHARTRTHTHARTHTTLKEKTREDGNQVGEGRERERVPSTLSFSFRAKGTTTIPSPSKATWLAPTFSSSFAFQKVLAVDSCGSKWRSFLIGEYSCKRSLQLTDQLVVRVRGF